MLLKFVTQNRWRRYLAVGLTVALAVVAGLQPWRLRGQGTANDPYPTPEGSLHVDLLRQTKQEAADKSTGCIQCHQNSGDPHAKNTINLGCVDCHGGNAATNDKDHAHVHPRFPAAWHSSANPGALLHALKP